MKNQGQRMYHQLKYAPLTDRLALRFVSCVLLAFCILLALDAEAAENGSGMQETTGVSNPIVPQPPRALTSVRIKDIARISCIYDIQLHGCVTKRKIHCFELNADGTKRKCIHSRHL